MIARIWKGKTHIKNYEAYAEFLIDKAIPDYKQIPGIVEIIFLKNTQGDEGHFTLLTIWNSIDDIKKFAGDNFYKAKYYSEDVNFLLDFQEEVEHFEVFANIKI